MGAAAAMLIVAMLICPNVPVVALILTAALGGLLLSENVLSNEPKSPPLGSSSKPLKGVKAQVSLENEAKMNEWEQRYEELKRREKLLKKYKV